MTATNHGNTGDDESGGIVSNRHVSDDDPLGAVFALLANERSRLVLARFVETGEHVVAFETLVDRVASAERAAETDPDAHRRRIAMSLHHSVLPKLADAGAIDYDRGRETVRYCSDSRLETVLERVIAVESALDSSESLGPWLRLFADRRRRAAVVVLQAYGESLTLPDLADEVAIREHGTALTRIHPEDVLRTYLSLYHTHVPKLESAGVVEYDQEADIVSPSNRDLLDRLDPLLLD